MSMLPELLRDAFPDADIPSTFYEAKKLISRLGLNYEKIDARPNDCMLYWGEDAGRRLVRSVTLRGSRQIRKGRSEKKKPAKILKYFPIKPRLQRLFMSSKTAEHMRWHEDDKNQDGKLRHPWDAEVWKLFDSVFPDVLLWRPSVHYVHETKLASPVQYRWMYSIKRFLGKLKSYVRNKAWPEGSIAEGYIGDELVFVDSGVLGYCCRSSSLSVCGSTSLWRFRKNSCEYRNSEFVETLAKAWCEYYNPRVVIMFVIQAEERNMYDQHWLSVILRERYPFSNGCSQNRSFNFASSLAKLTMKPALSNYFPWLYNTHHITTIRRTLVEIDQEGELLPDGTLSLDGKPIAVIYFRAGYTPVNYPSESARL
ncbi:hypothetical protein K1719_027814 [Acacia pycnantha]|nr:hypothetical protein K1719_027814 [Acacia pycnantha]